MLLFATLAFTTSNMTTEIKSLRHIQYSDKVWPVVLAISYHVTPILVTCSRLNGVDINGSPPFFLSY